MVRCKIITLGVNCPPTTPNPTVDLHVTSPADPIPWRWYHVTSRGNEGRHIFADDADRRRFLNILAQSAVLYGIEVHTYVLMTNHFHLVLHTPQANLSRFMQRFNTTYTVYFNRRHQRTGHLYQGRYKAFLVDVDSYLLELSRYVHLNPVRVKQNAALSPTKKRKILKTYRWSSYSGYINLHERPEFLCCNKILEIIGTADTASSRKTYRRFIQKGIDALSGFDLKDAVKAQNVLGSGDFQAWLRDHFLAGGKRANAELPAAKSLSLRFKSPREIATKLESVLAVSKKNLLKPRSGHRDERAILLELCRRHMAGGRSMSTISAALGIGVSALCQNRKRLEKRIERDPSLAQRFEQAAGALEDSE